MAATLLTVMLLIPYISEGVLLRKSTAMDFLQRLRETRASEVGEAEEAMEANEELEESPSLMYNGGAAQTQMNNSPEGGAVEDDGSGM